MTDSHTHEIERWGRDWWLFWIILPVGLIGGGFVTGLAALRDALEEVAGR